MAVPPSRSEPSAGLEVVTVRLPASLSVFKIVGGKETVEEYLAAVHKARGGSETAKEPDWSALYLQFDEAHALGTLPYRWDQGFSLASLWKLTLKGKEESPAPGAAASAGGEGKGTGGQVESTVGLQAVIVKGGWMAGGSVAGEEKADILKKSLELNVELPLMAQLGSRGMVLCCKETGGQWEMAVPHSCVSRFMSNTVQRREKEFEEKCGMTRRWRWIEEEMLKENPAEADRPEVQADGGGGVLSSPPPTCTGDCEWRRWTDEDDAAVQADVAAPKFIREAHLGADGVECVIENGTK
uniref:Uncharacterized protein n=1 Tax=Chromera velia CCMP2878 TaxID=1169474 RepID=A0A0G4I9W5_9ALVE|eukprot:Cvel_12373.t1-p1 / transcript=Cvel_12373.t1 / gene=Cvel_12373 / organism=Chromera_velia_CCMP2878 / gene_product=hypothetical protein / transcript_product=hypothetical protein / location=Cvel_scaffold807:64877-65767(+) / protein_length=297 / sequence_SO=supercontig / SO=protein_coding / is_pseudo=false